MILIFAVLICKENEIKIFSSFSEALPESDGAILLVFFSTDCYTCWNDMLEMKYFIEKNNLPVKIVGISKDSKKDLEPFLEKHSFYYPVICDRKRELYKKFNVDLEPFKIVLFKGKVLYKDNYYEKFSLREEKAKKCLLEVTLK